MPAILPRYAKQPGGGGSSLPDPIAAGDTPGSVLVWVGPGPDDYDWVATNAIYATIGCTFDGATSLLEVGRFVDVPVPYSCTILENEILVAPNGTVAIGVARSTYTGFPTLSNIHGSNPITVTSASKNKDSVLTGWTVALAAGDILRFTILSSPTPVLVTKATAFLKVLK